MTATTNHGVEIRYDAKGKLDEIVVVHPKAFHLERLANGHWWFRIDTDDGSGLMVNLSSRGIIKATPEWD